MLSCCREVPVGFALFLASQGRSGGRHAIPSYRDVWEQDRAKLLQGRSERLGACGDRGLVPLGKRLLGVLWGLCRGLALLVKQEVSFGSLWSFWGGCPVCPSLLWVRWGARACCTCAVL